ncbi:MULTISPECIES: penicillin acylase family protein [unclassified Streptomyces]|uniref:penicillin acylase family protein n=1 Tax=unclassified Streptomyces TaxID=2593676 RepID=UPI00364BFC0D
MSHAQNSGLSRRRVLGGAAGLAVAAAGLPSGTAFAASAPAQADEARWRKHAARVTITRDDWGVPHIVGETDADAVFGMMYAQAEDDFNRIEQKSPWVVLPRPRVRARSGRTCVSGCSSTPRR